MQRERLYLSALGNFTAAVAATNKEYMALRAVVNQAELELKRAESLISQHRIVKNGDRLN